MPVVAQVVPQEANTAKTYIIHSQEVIHWEDGIALDTVPVEIELNRYQRLPAKEEEQQIIELQDAMREARKPEKQ